MGWKEITLNGLEAYVAKIDSTHFKFSYAPDRSSTVYHVAQLKDPKNNTFYESLVDWLLGTSDIQGKEF